MEEYNVALPPSLTNLLRVWNTEDIKAAILKEFYATPQSYLLKENGVWMLYRNEYIDGNLVQTKKEVYFEECDCDKCLEVDDED